MGHEINYSKMSEEQREAQALKDALDWLTKKQIAALKDFVQQGAELKAFRVACMFTGFSGYPVEVLYKHFKATKDLAPK